MNSPALPLSVTLLLALACAVACAAPRTPIATVTPAPTRVILPTADPLFVSDGGGEPRSAGYWLLWNGCAPDNRAEMARSNGGRAAGWILLDDLLSDPGILLGELQVETCAQGLALLQARDLQGEDHAGDPAYALAAQLLAAQLNLAAGSAYCPAAGQAVQAGQVLLLSLGFQGSGAVLSVPAGGEEVDTARLLAEQLARFNTGKLCLP